MRFQVPQFIEVEDKIFGPLTLKEFIYIAGGVGLCVMFFVLMPWYIAAIPSAAALGIAFALAFYKINNKPFIFTLEAAVKYVFNPKLYIWKKVDEPSEPAAGDKKDAAVDPMGFIPKLSNSKLKDLTWDISTKKEALNPATKNDNEIDM